MPRSSLCRSRATSLLLLPLGSRLLPRSPMTRDTSLVTSSTTAPQMSLTAPIARSALEATAAVPSPSPSLVTDAVPPTVARIGPLQRARLPAVLVRPQLLAVEVKTGRTTKVGMETMVAREETTMEVQEEVVVDRILATDLKEARAMVAAQEPVVIQATEALTASLTAMLPEDRVVLGKMVPAKERTEPVVEAAQAALVVRARAPRDRGRQIKVTTSLDALEQPARLPSAWVSRLKLEA